MIHKLISVSVLLAMVPLSVIESQDPNEEPERSMQAASKPPEAAKRWRRTLMLAIAVTVHNIPGAC